MSLSLNAARMPRLSDKIAEQAAAAENVREKAEKKDLARAVIIKKRAPKTAVKRSSKN